jgi:hypothetical protein
VRVPVPAIGLPHVPQLWPRVEAALDAIVALERTMRTLPESIVLLREELAALQTVRDDVAGMRLEVRDLVGAVREMQSDIGRLPPDVGHLRGAVDAMSSTVDRVDGQMVGIGEALRHVDRIAGRVVDPLRRRTR